jgi:hypothetical protein
LAGFCFWDSFRHETREADDIRFHRSRVYTIALEVAEYLGEELFFCRVDRNIGTMLVLSGDVKGYGKFHSIHRNGVFDIKSDRICDQFVIGKFGTDIMLCKQAAIQCDRYFTEAKFVVGGFFGKVIYQVFAEVFLLSRNHILFSDRERRKNGSAGSMPGKEHRESFLL